MKRIETSDDRGFDEPRVMRDEATPDMRAAYHAALTLVSRLERECRAADAALEVLGIKNDGSSIAARIERLAAKLRPRDGLANAVSMLGLNATEAQIEATIAAHERAAAEADMAPRYEDSAECEWQAQRKRPAERLDDVPTDVSLVAIQFKYTRGED